MIESSQVGMQSVQYYTDATIMATNQLSAICTEIVEQWQQREYANFVELRLREMMEISKYIQRAADHQGKPAEVGCKAVCFVSSLIDFYLVHFALASIQIKM